MNLKLLNRYLKVLTSYTLSFPLYSPDSVSIIISQKCNLRCFMCNFWKDNSSTRKYEELKLADLAVLFKELQALGVHMVQLTGGEPFLRPDLNEIVKEAKKNKLKVSVVTNGTMINKDNVLDFVANVDLIYISIDSPFKEQYESIRGVPGSFERLLNSLDLLTETISKNSLATKVVIVATLTPEAIHEPEEMINLARDKGVDGIIYNPASNVFYANTTLQSFSLQDNSQMHKYSLMIDRINQLMLKGVNILRSNPFYLAASKEFLKGNNRFYKFACFGGGYNGPLIGADGRVFPCCAWNETLGNIKEKPFSIIWKSKEAKEARKKIKKGSCPVCFHHTRTFDFVAHAPFLFKDLRVLYQGFKILNKR